MGIRGNKNGVSIIAAVFIIVILAFMGVIFVTLIGTGSFTSVNEMQSAQALYVAEGGLESAVISLNTSTLGNRIACANVTGDANLTDEPLGQGQFRVTSDAGAPFYPANAATLAAGGINSTDTTINTNAAPAGYASSGRIMIDRELIDYSGISGSSFVGAVRGRDGTTAVSHAKNTRVGQYQCGVTSEGGITTVAAPTARRTVKEGIQLQEGWAAGGGGLPTDNLNSVYCTSATDCWAVGDAGTIIYWNGTSWSSITSPTTQNLNEVYCTNANNCWAVGQNNGNDFTFVQWDGAAWTSQLLTDAVNVQDLNGVYCIAANDCWAVGSRNGNNFTFVRRTGAGWAAQPLTDAANRQNLNDVYCIATTNDCWAVGDLNGNNFTFVRRTGAGWAAQPLTDAANRQNLNDVYCIATTNDCWAVGSRNGNNFTFVRRTGAGWAAQPLTDAANRENLNDVYCIATTNDCWAVGDLNGNNFTFVRRTGAGWAAQPLTDAANRE